MAATSRDAVLARASAAIVGACLLTLAATAMAFSAPALAERLGWARPVTSYVSGERIDLDSSVYRAARRTIFLFARSSCGACQASRSVMAAIVADVASQPDVQVVLVTGLAHSEDERAFAREVGGVGLRLLQVDLGTLRLRYVPTAVLTDASGLILVAREGLLTESDRSDIVQMAFTQYPR